MKGQDKTPGGKNQTKKKTKGNGDRQTSRIRIKNKDSEDDPGSS